MTTIKNEIGKPARSERANVRRDVLRALRDVASMLRILITTWSCDRRVYDEKGRIDEDGRVQHWHWRRWEEFPENNAGTMREHARWLHHLASRLSDIAIRLSNEADAVKAIEQERMESAG